MVNVTFKFSQTCRYYKLHSPPGSEKTCLLEQQPAFHRLFFAMLLSIQPQHLVQPIIRYKYLADLER